MPGAAGSRQEVQGAATGAAREKTGWIWKDIEGYWRICVDLGSGGFAVGLPPVCHHIRPQVHPPKKLVVGSWNLAIYSM